MARKGRIRLKCWINEDGTLHRPSRHQRHYATLIDAFPPGLWEHCFIYVGDKLYRATYHQGWGGITASRASVPWLLANRPNEFKRFYTLDSAIAATRLTL